METVEQLHISIKLGPRLAQFAAPASSEQKLLQESVNSFTDQLVSDLGLPAQASIEILPSLNSETNDFTAKINGLPCRVFLPTRVPEHLSTRELANYLADGIYQNRELCLSHTMSERLWKDWRPDNGKSDTAPDFSSEEFHQLLLALVRRGFRTDRIKTLTKSGTAQPEVLAENAVSAASRLTLYLSKEQASISSFSIGGTAAPGLPEYSSVEYQAMQDGLFSEIGLVLPNLTIETTDRLEGNEFQFRINDLRQPPMSGLSREEVLVNDTVESLAQRNIVGDPAFNPLNGLECAIVRGVEAANTCAQANIKVWGPAGFIVLCLAREVRSHAGSLLRLDLLEFLMRELERDYPVLVKVALARYDVKEIASTLRELLDEEISIRDMRAILEGLLTIDGATTKDLSDKIVFFPYTLSLCQLNAATQDTTLKPKDYANQVRTFLKRYISHKYVRGQSTLSVYLIDPEVEERLNKCEAEPLTSEEHSKLIRGVLNEVNNSPTATAVILTTIETRRLLRKLLEKEFPWLAVLSFQELSENLNIQPLGRVSWGTS